MRTAGLVAHFGKLPQKLLEDLPHGMVIDHIPILMRLKQPPQHIIRHTPNQRRELLELRHSFISSYLASRIVKLGHSALLCKEFR